MATFALFGIVFVSAILLLSKLVAPSSDNASKAMPYECGMEPDGEANSPFNIRYYILAILFVAFDVEALFLYPWALVLRRLGISALLEMAAFMAVLLAGLLYVWKKGALQWL